MTSCSSDGNAAEKQNKKECHGILAGCSFEDHGLFDIQDIGQHAASGHKAPLGEGDLVTYDGLNVSV